MEPATQKPTDNPESNKFAGVKIKATGELNLMTALPNTESSALL